MQNVRCKLSRRATPKLASSEERRRVFSNRLPTSLATNRLTDAIRRFRSTSRPLIDLTESNPTRAGFNYPADLLSPLADPRGALYLPAPFGLPPARRAVAA